MILKPIRIPVRSKRHCREFHLTVACVDYMTLQYKKILCVHTPNGERRLLGDGDKLKKMGVIAGFPDLFIYEPNQEYHGFAIELKIKKGKLSVNQLKVRDKHLNSGYK